MSAATEVRAVEPGDLAQRDVTFKKIIWRFIPFLTLIWFLAWIDRTNIGFAKLRMMDDLGWSDAIYGAGAGIFFIAYFIFEVPSNLLLEKIGGRKTIMRIAIGWGVVSVLMAFVTAPWQFYSLRFLLGAFEAGLQPGVLLFLTYWIPAHRRAKAMGFFLSASAMSLMIGSPLAAYIMTHMDQVGMFHGWQWLFILEGIPSILCGILVWWILTDKPNKAGWLTEREKADVQFELAQEEKALGHREGSAWGSLKRPPMWILIAIYFGIVAANATLTFYGPSLVSDAGVDDLSKLGWIMAGIYFFGWIGMIGNGWVVDWTRNPRLVTITFATLGAVGLLGAMVSINTQSLVGVVVSLAVSAMGTMGAISAFWNLPPLIISGTALVAGLALINSIANLAGYFSPQLLGSMKTNTGSYSQGLMIIAGVELLAVLLMIFFVRKKEVPVVDDAEVTA